MGKFIVYQGYNEQFRWRKVDDDGSTLVQGELYPTREAAIDAVNVIDSSAEIEIRPTIQEVAEQEASNG